MGIRERRIPKSRSHIVGDPKKKEKNLHHLGERSEPGFRRAGVFELRPRSVNRFTTFWRKGMAIHEGDSQLGPLDSQLHSFWQAHCEAKTA